MSEANIILASASPRRRELLEMLGVRGMTICPARGDERPPEGVSPSETVMALARAKALEVAARFSPADVVIAADTIVELDGAILGKPRDEGDAFKMLRALSGRRHRVFTGLAVLRGGTLLTDAVETAVCFRELSDREISAYIASGEPMDKAGAYGAQGKASLFVERIEGDFFNVMGLPLCKLGRMLAEMDVRLI